MNKVSKKYIIFALGLFLFLCLALLPKTPFSANKTLNSDVKTAVAQALSLLETSPMSAIEQLIALSEKYPLAAEPLIELGFASLKTQQYDKAFVRFEKALSLLKDAPYNAQKEQTFLGLSMTYTARLENSVEIDELLPSYLSLLENWQLQASNESLKNELAQKITQLQLQLNKNK